MKLPKMSSGNRRPLDRLCWSVARGGADRDGAAQSPATTAETVPSKGAAAPLPSNLTALLPKSRQLLHDGDLQAAERVAQFDLKYHSNVSQLAGSLEALTSIYKQSGRYEEALATGARYQHVLETIPNADPSKRQDMALMLAEVLAGAGKYPQAVARVDDALKIGEGWRKTDPLWESHAYAVRAQIERAAGQLDAASADWREVETRTRRILDQVTQTGPNVELEESALKLLTEALVSTDRVPQAIAVREQFLARHQDDQTRTQLVGNRQMPCGSWAIAAGRTGPANGAGVGKTRRVVRQCATIESRRGRVARTFGTGSRAGR